MTPSVNNVVKNLKSIAKLILLKSGRRKFLREIKIRKQQNKLLPLIIQKQSKKLIIFFTYGSEYATGKEHISGGLLSIHSIFEETLRLKEVHEADVIFCVFKGENIFYEFSSFKSKYKVLRFQQLKKISRNIDECIIHIPEYLVTSFYNQLKNNNYKFLNKKRLHINILNQNIKLMPEVGIISGLKKYAELVTQTTAHKQYATKFYKDYYQIQLHHLSTFIAPERYTLKTFDKKKNRIAISPDDPIKNALIIKKIKKYLPQYEVVVINEMTYEYFKEFISEVKFTFTFGEGLDGYYCETVLTGGISFAIYNSVFFTKEYQSLDTVYNNFEDLLENCISKILSLDNPESYRSYNKEQFDLLTSQYKFSEYQENIRKFYLKEYTFS